MNISKTLAVTVAMAKKASNNSKSREKTSADIKPAATQSTSVIGIIKERQNNLPQDIVPANAPIDDDDGSVRGTDPETEIVVPDGGWGWFVVSASFVMHVIGGF